MLSKNVINEVIKEWSWRVPTGSPDVKSTEHLNILRDLLIVDFGASTYTVNQVIHSLFEAKLSPEDQFIQKHSKDSGKWIGPVKARLLYAALKKESKLQTFVKYLKKLPGGEPGDAVKGAIKGFSAKAMTEFAQLLWDKTVPEAGNWPKSGAAGKLFNLKPSGAGRGEMWLGALIKDSEVQGGGKSYDLVASGGPYEVKDYKGTNKSAIRAGVEATITKFPFWKQIVKTLDVIDEMETQGYWDLLEYKLSPMMPGIVSSLIKEKKYLIQRGYSKIITGEFNSKGDYPSMKKFYEIANILVQAETGGTYDQITFTGTGLSDATYAITDISPDKLSPGKKVSLDLLTGHGSDIESVINLLRTLDYVKNPSNFPVDINYALEQIIDGGDANVWIIFRKTGMKVIEAKVKNFTYKSISQNGVKFAELE